MQEAPTSPTSIPVTAVLLARSSGPLHGGAPLVGDKSLSHRALLLGALANGTTLIENLSPCADVGRTLHCLSVMGVPVRRISATSIEVAGGGPSGLGAMATESVAGGSLLLPCGDSGTTMRLLAGILSGQAGGRFTLDADPGLRRRPMGRVVEPLRAMGAEIDSTDGHPPLVIHGGTLHAAEIWLPQASAQVGSAVLLAGLNAHGTTIVHYPVPVRDHTERMLAEMGAPLKWTPATSILSGPVPRLAPPAGGVYHVANDPSAAAFLIAAAAMAPGSHIVLADVNLNPGRTGFFEVLKLMGAAIEERDLAIRYGEPMGTVALAHRPLVGIDVAADLVPRLIDELPLVAVVATQAVGRTRVRGATELRVKESDRIAAVVDGLRRLGARIEALPDGFVVDGPTPLIGAAVDGYDDHRIVMAMAVAGLVATGETRITGAGRVADSFPGFVEAMVVLGGALEVV